MCRDMGLILGARPAAGLSVLVAPVGFSGSIRWVERTSPVVEVGDGDVVVVGEREHAFACVGGADAEVVHPAGAAEAHLAGGVEAVVAQPVVALGVSVAGRERLRCGAVGVAWCAAVKRAVRALLVVVRSELVELALQLRDGAGGWSGASQRCWVWWNRSVLPWVWGCPGIRSSAGHRAAAARIRRRCARR